MKAQSTKFEEGKMEGINEKRSRLLKLKKLYKANSTQSVQPQICFPPPHLHGFFFPKKGNGFLKKDMTQNLAQKANKRKVSTNFTEFGHKKLLTDEMRNNFLSLAKQPIHLEDGEKNKKVLNLHKPLEYYSMTEMPSFIPLTSKRNSRLDLNLGNKGSSRNLLYKKYSNNKVVYDRNKISFFDLTEITDVGEKMTTQESTDISQLSHKKKLRNPKKSASIASLMIAPNRPLPPVKLIDKIKYLIL